MQVELIAITRYLHGGTPEELLEHAGRVCYRYLRFGESEIKRQRDKLFG